MGQFLAAAPTNQRPRHNGTIDRIVLHTTEGGYAGTLAWFQSPVARVSAHFVVSQKGEVTQMVLERDCAYHAAPWNDRSIGIEHEGHAADATWPDALLDASAALVADICQRRSIPADRTHIVGHYEVPGATHTDPGAHWPWERYMALVAAHLRSP
jgi:N-acetyl-anhydromuramyl-L-alanine amidase AmpD